MRLHRRRFGCRVSSAMYALRKIPEGPRPNPRSKSRLRHPPMGTNHHLAEAMLCARQPTLGSPPVVFTRWPPRSLIRCIKMCSFKPVHLVQEEGALKGGSGVVAQNCGLDTFDQYPAAGSPHTRDTDPFVDGKIINVSKYTSEVISSESSFLSEKMRSGSFGGKG